MAKVAPDLFYAQGFNWVALADSMVACAGSSLVFTQMFTSASSTGGGSRLALKAMVTGSGNGDFTSASGAPSGWILTMTAKSAVPIDSSGSAIYVALLSQSSSVVRYITTCTNQYLTAGGTVDFPSWTINVQAPT